MSKEKEIKDMIRALAKMPAKVLITGTVEKVNETNIDVKILDDLLIEGVRIKPTTENSNFFFIRPKKGSTVKMISETGDFSSLIVVSIDEVESFELKHNNFLFKLDTTTNKMTLKNGQTSIKELFDDLKAIINGLTVSTPVGPSGTPLPTTIQAVQQLSVKYNNLFE